MTTLKQQTLIEAPVDEVWGLLEDPASYPKWAGAIDVTGVPTKIEKGATFRQTSPGPLGREITTTYKVEELDDLHEIKLRCQTSGLYSHWRLTEARGNTFTEVEIGKEPDGLGLGARAISATMINKRSLREQLESSLDGIRRVLSRRKQSVQS